MLKELFRCPRCRGIIKQDSAREALACSECLHEMGIVENIPVLVADKRLLDKQIDSARTSGKNSWYESPQMPQLSGPYRHHLLKRRAYVEGVLARHRASSTKRIVGLDLGCGDGTNLAWIRKYCTVLYGSDYNLLRLLRASRTASADQLFLADVTNYPAVDNSFEIIFWNHVLEHIPDDTKALREAYRILAPGGVLVLGVPNEGAFFWWLAYRLQPLSLATTDHVNFYTLQSLSAKCREAGFVIRESHRIGWGLPHWWLDEKIRRYKWADDLFEWIGRRFLSSQATSLYLVLSK